MSLQAFQLSSLSQSQNLSALASKQKQPNISASHIMSQGYKGAVQSKHPQYQQMGIRMPQNKRFGHVMMSSNQQNPKI